MRDENGFSLFEFAIAGLVFGLIAFAGWHLLLKGKDFRDSTNKGQGASDGLKDRLQNIDDFQSCAEAGNPVQESHPRRCTYQNRTYTETL